MVVEYFKKATFGRCRIFPQVSLKASLSVLRIVAGILETIANEPATHAEQQWRSIDKIYSQRFYKFPAYDLAILGTTKPFEFNDFVNKIPYATQNQDFDGVCVATTLRPTTSWAEKKTLFSENLQMITRHECERTLLRSCRLFYCTAYKTRYIFAETEGGGLVCHGTDDKEDKGKGVLVGVTSLINVHLPTLHHRTAIFGSWIKDAGITLKPDKMVELLCFFVLLIKLL